LSALSARRRKPWPPWAHVHARIKKFGRDFRRVPGDTIEMRGQPIDPAINFRRKLARKVAHVAFIAMRARHHLGHAPARGAAAIGGVISIAAFAVDQFFDQCVNVHDFP